MNTCLKEILKEEKCEITNDFADFFLPYFKKYICNYQFYYDLENSAIVFYTNKNSSSRMLRRNLEEKLTPENKDYLVPIIRRWLKLKVFL